MKVRLKTSSLLVMLSGWCACLVALLVIAWMQPGDASPEIEETSPSGATTCLGDLDGDNDIDFNDLLVVLANWGPCPGCSAPEIDCGAGCVNPLNDPNHCGACGNACPAGTFCSGGTCVCLGGLTDCGGLCIDTSSDPNNCGGCGLVCPPGTNCQNGTCVLNCPPGWTDCGGICRDLQNDTSHCGACGNQCPLGWNCVNGSCISP